MDEEAVSPNSSTSSDASSQASPKPPKKLWSPPTMTVMKIRDTGATVLAGAGDIEFTKTAS